MTSKEVIEVTRILKRCIKILLNSDYGITSHEIDTFNKPIKLTEETEKVKELLKGK